MYENILWWNVSHTKKYRTYNNFKFPNSSYISKNGFYIPSGLGLKKNEINKVIFYLKKELN